MSSTYDVLIVGLGRMGSQFDSAPATDSVYSHAKAFHQHPGFKLSAGVDIDPEARRLFSEQWKVPTFENLASVSPQSFDLIVVATPTPTHCETLKAVMRFRPKMVLLEKPIAANAAQIREMTLLLESPSTPCVVNYIRRSDPGIRQLRTKIKGGELGAFHSAFGYYNRGLFNNASHLIDLTAALTGERFAFDQVIRNDRWFRPAVDPEPTFSLRSSAGWALFSPVSPPDAYDLFELDLFFSKARVKLSQFTEKIDLYPLIDDPVFAGHKRLADVAQSIPTQMNQYQLNVVNDLHTLLQQSSRAASDPALASFADALKTENLCLDIFSECQKRGN